MTRGEMEQQFSEAYKQADKAYFAGDISTFNKALDRMGDLFLVAIAAADRLAEDVAWARHTENFLATHKGFSFEEFKAAKQEAFAKRVAYAIEGFEYGKKLMAEYQNKAVA